LFNDNFGLLLSKLFRAPTTGALSNVGGFFDITGAPLVINIYGLASATLFNEFAGGNVQVGKGTTPATRQDTNIETPFTNGGVEDNPVNAIVGAYNPSLAKVEIPALISPTAGAGAISEVVRTRGMENSVGVGKEMLLTRDNVSPVSNFIAGQAINVNHEVDI
jgi:hypothetical protein